MNYKGFDKDLKCKNFSYEVGKDYEMDGPIKACARGFHACEAPMDVLRYYGPADGSRYCLVEQSGLLQHEGDDTKVASSKIRIVTEISFRELVNAQIEYTRQNAESGQEVGKKGCIVGGDGSNLTGGNRSNLTGGIRSSLAGGNRSNLAGGNRSNLAGGEKSNIAGGEESNLAGGEMSSLAGGDWSNIAGGGGSNLAGGNGSNIAGGDWSNLAGGEMSSLAGGDGSNLTGGNRSSLAGGEGSMCAVRNGKAKGGKNSVLVLTTWEWIEKMYTPTAVQAIVIDGKKYKPDTWYALRGGEVVEADDGEVCQA